MFCAFVIDNTDILENVVIIGFIRVPVDELHHK